MAMSSRVSCVIFEGGPSGSIIEDQMLSVRRAVVLDNLDKLLGSPDFDEVILCTDNADLASAAIELGAKVQLTDSDFHFGRQLQDVINSHSLEKVLYMGGASAPLIGSRELEEIAFRLRVRENTVQVNNVQSPDMVAFTPANAVNFISPPPADNQLGDRLRLQAGLTRLLIPNSPWINYDVDTPADLMILTFQERCGPRTSAALRALELDVSKFHRAAAIMLGHRTEVGLIGRVGAPIVKFINSNFRCRLRVMSEERGMKALERDEPGKVASFVGRLIDDIGPDRFFEYLADTLDLAFFDTRVLFAHWQGRVSVADRYHSDLGQWRKIQHPQVRDLTRAAEESDALVILGGHSLVYGGLWAFLQTLLPQKSP